MVKVKGTNRVFGEIELSGAKNAALPLIVGACLCSEPVTLHNMPVELNDLGDMPEMKALGLFEHSGVAAHPGDLGMKTIAQRIFEPLKELL